MGIVDSYNTKREAEKSASHRSRASKKRFKSYKYHVVKNDKSGFWNVVEVKK